MNRKLLYVGAVIVLFWANRLQAAEVVTGLATNLMSSTEGAISLRFQNHSWMTPDGVTHLLFNTGSNSMALELWSSSDAVNWSKKTSIAGSSRGSQADGVLDESNLYVAYPTSGSEVRLAVFRYRSRTKSWRLVRDIMVAKEANTAFDRPSVAVDQLGRVWIVACAAKDEGTTTVGFLSLFVVENELTAPRNVGEFGTRNQSEQRSGRLLRIPDGLMLIYSDHPDPQSEAFRLNFTSRIDSAPLDSAWSQPQMILEYPTSENDVNGAHFSAAVDRAGNAHLATRREDGLVYARLTSQQVVISKTLEDQDVSPYPQVAVSGLGSVFVLFPVVEQTGIREIQVLTSTDQGQQFSHTHQLSFLPDRNRSQPRIECPAEVSDFLPVLLQYSLNNTRQKLAGFFLDID
jgi:hypothetical protein